MRESNFCNPAQNKASVCISSAVYDRRAIDCTATLPLINSLNHLAYLTSTSPRIREMVTLDGGLERLIRILRTVPKTPSPQARAFSIKEMQAVWKWSLAFQCVVNIGVRGSESVRTRVVEAGMIPVTIRVLESYLRNMERLKDEKRKDSLLHHHRHEARRDDRTSRERVQSASASNAPLSASADSSRSRRLHPAPDTLAPASNATAQHNGPASSASQASPTRTHHADAQPDSNAIAPTNLPNHLLTETRPTTPLEDPVAARRSSVFANMDAQSSADDFMPSQPPAMPVVDPHEPHATMPLIESIDPISLSSSGSPPNVGPDGTPRALSSARADDRNLEGMSSSEDLRSHAAEASGSGSDGAEDAEMFADDADDSEIDAAQFQTVRSTDSDNAPSSAPSNIEVDEDLEERRTPRPDRRALAPLSGNDSPPLPAQSYVTPNRPTSAIAPPLFERQDTVRPSRDFSTTAGSREASSTNLASTALAAQVGSQDASTRSSSLFDRQQQPAHQHHHHHNNERLHHQQQGSASQDQRHHHHHHNHHHHHHHSQPHDHTHQSRASATTSHYDDVQLGRQRSAHPEAQQQTTPREEPRTTAVRPAQPAFDAGAAHPAVVQLSNLADTNARAGIDVVYREEEVLLSLQLLAYLSKYPHVRMLFHSTDFSGPSLMGPLDSLNEEIEQATKRNKSWDPAEPPRRNVFAIAEKFTLRSRNATYPAPRLSMEIQYWAGVIMRNACRKDESRGGIRQCANMLCGKWEEYPREFAKCRRCRKAKYCSKQCQSKGWQMGHRYWCSAKSDEAEAKDKEREKTTEAQRDGRQEDGGAAPRIVPMAAHAGEAAAFGHGLPDEPADAMRDPGARGGLDRTDDMQLDGADRHTTAARRRASGEPTEGSAHAAVPRSEHRDGRTRPGHSARDREDGVQAAAFLPDGSQGRHSGLDSLAHAAGFGRPDSGMTHEANGAVPDLNGHGTQASGSQHGGPSRMHRQFSSSASSVEAMGVNGHAASGEDDVWTRGAAEPGAPRLGMLPSPYPGVTGALDRGVGSAGHSASSSRTSLGEGVAEAQRGARRGALPGGMGLPTTMLRQDLRDRRVTSLASLDTVDGSDVSEDETERRLAQTQDIHPALAAAAAAAGLRARDGQVPPQAPQRTDLAGRPLPPPVIASQNGEEDELALGGRATPGVAGDQDFGTGEIDQMLGHWATRRPDAIGLQHRLAEVRAEMPSPERSLSPEAGVHGGETSETVMGARSDDEDLTATSRTSRYGGLYRDAAFGPMARGQTPQPHHRLHQPRSASGFSAFGGHATRFGYGESMGETSTLQGYRPSMVSSPLAQTPARRTSGYEGSTSQNVEDVAMASEAVLEPSRSAVHSRLASPDDDMIDDADDRDDISMEL